MVEALLYLLREPVQGIITCSVANVYAVTHYGEDVLGNAEFMEILFPAIRADAAVTETYLNTSKGRRSIARSQLFQAKKTKRFVENP